MSELPSPLLPEISATPSPQPEPHPAQRGGKRIFLMGGAVVVGVGALCGIGYAAWAGYLPNPLMKRPTPEQLFATLNAITSAQTTVDMHFALEPREEGVEPLDFSLFREPIADEESIFSTPTFLALTQMLASDLELNISLASSFAKENEGADQETHIVGTYNANNISANIDVTTRTVAGTTYIKPDVIPLPIPLFDMNSLKGTWINLGDEADDRQVFRYLDPFAEEETVPKDEAIAGADPQAELLALVQQGIQDGAIIFSAPQRVTYNDARAWYTEAIIDGEKLRETVINTGKNRETLFPEITEYSLFTDKFLENSGKERAKDTYRELFKRMELSAMLNNDSSPLLITFSTRLAPKLEEDTFKDRQITLETKIHFTSINTPLTLAAPENTITTNEALALLMGADPQDELRKKQQTSISDLQEALTLYKKVNNMYPETLNELIGTTNQQEMAFAFPAGTKEVMQIPLDIVTGKPYVYEATKNGYTLRYEMPANVNEEFSSYGITVEGTNTATELLWSEEGAKISDKDKDGLSAYDEVIIYGTSDNRGDSDADGYEDKVEVDGGYNPAGDGPLIVPE